MTTLVTQHAPVFKASAVMPSGVISPISLSDYQDRYILLFFYPLDFTFVCPTEIVAFSDAEERFQAEKVQILGCSVDSEYSHLAWRNIPRREGGLGEIRFPLISDLNKTISTSYGVLLPSGIALRGLFLIDRQGVVRHQLINDLPLGRSVDEAFRMVKALKFVEEHGEVCPANWHDGDPAINPDILHAREWFREKYTDIK